MKWYRSIYTAGQLAGYKCRLCKGSVFGSRNTFKRYHSVETCAASFFSEEEASATEGDQTSESSDSDRAAQGPQKRQRR